MSSHTKGPWSVSKPQIHNGGLSVDIDSADAGHWALATVVWQMEDDKFDDKPSEQCIANAYLIGASPELFDDLIEAATTLRRYETLHRAKNTEESTAKAEVNAALAVRFEATIAKAKGLAK